MGPRFEARAAADGTDPRVATMAAVTAILALSVTDDEFGTEAAIDRLLAYIYRQRPHPSAAFAGVDGAGVDRPFRLFHERPRHAMADRAGLAHARAVGAATGDSPYGVTARRLYPVVRVFAREEFGAQRPRGEQRLARIGRDLPGCCRRHARSRRSPNACSARIPGSGARCPAPRPDRFPRTPRTPAACPACASSRPPGRRLNPRSG